VDGEAGGLARHTNVSAMTSAPWNLVAAGRRRRPLSTAAVAAAIACCAAAAPPARARAPAPRLPQFMTPKIVKSIDLGLKYLVKTQRRDGSWLNNGSYGGYPCVMTSLSGLALMAGGSTPETGPYAREVRKAMRYVLKVAESKSDGLIALPSYRSMYSHGFSMLFLASCCGTEVDTDYEKRLRGVLTRAVEATGAAQSNRGGWYYGPSKTNDEGSVTVTQLQAIRACRNAGIKVPVEIIDKAVGYLKYCQMPDGGICYCARSRGSSRPAISAAAIACFYSAGLYDRHSGGEKGKEAQMVERLVSYVKGHVSVPHGGHYSGYYFYTHLYMSQAMYMRGGDDWRGYYPAMASRLMDMQALDGSWNGDNIGTTYGTAIASIILQLPYGYLPILQR
jgi:hypothetical protein